MHPPLSYVLLMIIINMAQHVNLQPVKEYGYKYPYYFYFFFILLFRLL